MQSACYTRKVFAAILVLALGGAGEAGPLDDIREEVHGGGSNDSSGESDDDDDDDSSSSSGWCWSCGSSEESGGAGGGWDMAPDMSRSNWPYPYYDGAPGYYLRADETRAVGVRRWNVRAHAGGAYVVEGLWRATGGLRAGLGMFEMDTEWDWFHDPVTRDSLTIGDFNLGIAALRGRQWVLRAGLGGRIMYDSQPTIEGRSGPAGGFNFMTGFSVFPARPVVVSADFDVGSLGQAFVWKAGGRLGVMLGPLEVFAGADHTRIGKVGLTGINFGLGGWF